MPRQANSRRLPPLQLSTCFMMSMTMVPTEKWLDLSKLINDDPDDIPSGSPFVASRSSLEYSRETGEMSKLIEDVKNYLSQPPPLISCCPETDKSCYSRVLVCDVPKSYPVRSVKSLSQGLAMCLGNWPHWKLTERPGGVAFLERVSLSDAQEDFVLTTIKSTAESPMEYTKKYSEFREQINATHPRFDEYANVIIDESKQRRLDAIIADTVQRHKEAFMKKPRPKKQVEIIKEPFLNEKEAIIKEAILNEPRQEPLIVNEPRQKDGIIDVWRMRPGKRLFSIREAWNRWTDRAAHRFVGLKRGR